MTKSVQDRVYAVLHDQLGVGIHEIQPTDDLYVDLGTDSLDLVEIAMAMEDEFEIEASDDECEACKTVQQVVDLVTLKLSTVPTMESTPKYHSLSLEGDYKGCWVCTSQDWKRAATDHGHDTAKVLKAEAINLAKLGKSIVWINNDVLNTF